MALSATEKHEMRMWGTDVDAVTWPDGTKPPPWVKASTDDARRGQKHPHARPSVRFVEPHLLCLHIGHIGAVESFCARNPSPCSRSSYKLLAVVFEGVRRNLCGKSRRGVPTSPLPVSISTRPSGTRRTNGRTKNWASELPERSRSLWRSCGRRPLPGCYPCGGRT